VKKIIAFIFILICFKGVAQTPLFIPDTLIGPSYVLNMHEDSVQFFPGSKSYTYAFNANKYLGPTLILNKGTNINITVNNQISDTTSMHWHGLHVPPIWDGGPHSPILPGGTWNPVFTVMDNAATYWYHPHPDMKTAKQAIKGAAGLIIVRDSTESTLAIPRRYGIDDFPIIAQCQQYDSVNQAMPLGMEDSTLLVNGTMDPYLNAPAQVIRLRLLNASGERVFNFGFTANRQFYQIASDGGLLDNPVLETRVRLAPGERAEILINLTGMTGQSFYLMSYGSEMPIGMQGGPTMPMPPGSPPMDSPLNGIDFNIMQINVATPTVSPITSIPSSLTTNTPYSEMSANTTRTIRFTADSLMVMDGPFYFNDSTFNMMRIDYTIPLNSVEVWKLVNETMVAHPFHIHDVQFYILDRNGNPPGQEEMGRKDVVLVPTGDSVRFITKFTDFADPLIPYMFHCHILMHEDDGMMGQFIVSPSGVGINEISKSENDLIIFPNPTQNKISIKVKSLENNSDAKVFIYNTLGESMGICQLNRDGTCSIDVSGWNNGVYFCSVVSNNDIISKTKFVVSK
jgi:bilirubin oxidase